MSFVKRAIVASLFASLVCTAATASAQTVADNYSPVTEDMLIDPPAEDWAMWRRTYGHWGHSPLDQINTGNVDSLRLAWAWTMGPGRQETTPLVHDGMMFLVQACDFVEALDLRDGSRIWEYRREQMEHPASLACVNRNGALYEDKLFIATHDAHLVALHARTGEVAWDVPVGDWTIGQHYSGGPMIIKNRVVAGMSGCYFLNTRCWVSAHNVDSGAEEWRTYTIPARGEYGYESWGDIPDEDRRRGLSDARAAIAPLRDGRALGDAARGRCDRGPRVPDLRGLRGNRRHRVDASRDVGCVHHLLRILGRNRARRNADLGRALPVPGALAERHQPQRRSDDSLRPDHVRDWILERAGQHHGAEDGDHYTPSQSHPAVLGLQLQKALLKGSRHFSYSANVRPSPKGIIALATR